MGVRMLLVTTGTDGRCDGLWNLIGVST